MNWSDVQTNYTSLEIIRRGLCYMNTTISSFISKQMSGAQLYLPKHEREIHQHRKLSHYLVSAPFQSNASKSRWY